MSDSLIKRDEAQRELFEAERDSGEVFALTRTEGKGEYTAQRLMSCRPEVYRAVTLLLAQGCGPRSIMRQIKAHFGEGVDSRTIAAVQDAEVEFIPTIKERLGRRNMLIAHGLQELMMAAIDDESDLLKPKSASQLQSLAVTTGIMQQRGSELIDGGVVIKHAHEHRKFASVDEMFQALPADRKPVLEAEIIGFGPSERGAKRVSAAGDEPGRSCETETSDPAAPGADSGRSS